MDTLTATFDWAETQRLGMTPPQTFRTITADEEVRYARASWERGGVPGPLYADFNATRIDPHKWFGIESGTEPRGFGTEAIRQIQDNRLRLVYRAYGRADSDSGMSRNQLGLVFHNSAAVTAITALSLLIEDWEFRLPHSISERHW